MMNPFQDNPALAGSVECLDLHFGQRAQWAGFEGAPTTSFVNIHGQMTEQGPNFHGVGGRVESGMMATGTRTTMGPNRAFPRRWDPWSETVWEGARRRSTTYLGPGQLVGRRASAKRELGRHGRSP